MPLLLTFRPLDGPVTAAFKRADRVLPGMFCPSYLAPHVADWAVRCTFVDEGLARKSFEIVWQLRQLQTLAPPPAAAQAKQNKEIDYHPDLQKVAYHAEVVFSDLLAALSSILYSNGEEQGNDGSTASAQQMSDEALKEAFVSLCTLWLAALDVLARVVDDLQVKDEAAKEQGHKEIEEKVLLKVRMIHVFCSTKVLMPLSCQKTSQLVQLLFKGLPITVGQAVSPSCCIASDPADALTGLATAPDQRNPELASSCLLPETVQVLATLASIDGYRPFSRFIGLLQPVLAQYIHFFTIRHIGQLLAEVGAGSHLLSKHARQQGGKQNMLDQLVQLLLALQASYGPADNVNKDDASIHSKVDELLSENGRMEVMDLASKMIDLDADGKLEHLVCEEAYKAVLGGAHAVSDSCGFDIIDSMLLSMQV